MKSVTERQHEIMETAMRLIADGGIQKCSIRNIAASIGVSEPAIYRHFKSKRSLLSGILSNFSGGIGVSLDLLIKEESDAMTKISSFLDEIAGLFTRKPMIASIVFSEEIFQNDRVLADLVYSVMNRTREGIRSILSDGQKKGAVRKDVGPDQLALMVLGSLRLLVTQWRLSGHTFELAGEVKKLSGTIVKLYRA